MTSNIKIGSLELKSKVISAPLAGVTDFAMRSIIREYSKNCLLTSEMISSEALMQNKESLAAYTNELEKPISMQIEGHKPELMHKAAKLLEKKASVIDINMGCPVRKVTGGNDGCSLMNTPELAAEITRAVKEAVNIPVTCKFRLGWSADKINFIDFAQKMQQAGAAAVTIHARTRAQLYSGKADWKILADLKGNIDIPYFANGDITSPEKASECLEITKASGIAIGRALMGDLTLISRIEKYLDEGVLIKEPDLKEKIRILKKHLEAETAFRGDEAGLKFFRKFYPCCIKGIRGGAEYRKQLVTAPDYKSVTALLDEIAERETE